MNFSILYNPAFLHDTMEATNWYSNISSTVTARFLAGIKNAEKRLASHPLSFKKAGNGQFRKIKVPRYPYYIYYRIDAAIVHVMALIHESRSNRFIKRRLS